VEGKRRGRWSKRGTWRGGAVEGEREVMVGVKLGGWEVIGKLKRGRGERENNEAGADFRRNCERRGCMDWGEDGSRWSVRDEDGGKKGYWMMGSGVNVGEGEIRRWIWHMRGRWVAGRLKKSLARDKSVVKRDASGKEGGGRVGE